MTLSRENRIWLFAVGISVLFHALFFVFGVNFQQKKRETPIVVKLVEKNSAKVQQTVAAEKQSKKESPAKKNPAVPQEAHTSVQKANSDLPPKTQQVLDNKNQKQNVDNDGQKGKSENIENSGAGSADGNAKGNGENNVSGGHGTGNAAGEVVDVNTLVITKKIPPQYPAFSRKRKEEGTVHLLITISENSVSECKIEKSSGYARLDEAARRAVAQWKFSHSGNVRARVPVVFKISD